MMGVRLLLGRALRLPLRLIPADAVMPILTGPLQGCRWISSAATHGCWLGHYERTTQRVFTGRLHPGDVVYDIGANVGFFTLLASRLVGLQGQVYAFEPLPRNLTLLERHLQLNGCQNVTVFELALAARSGSARFVAEGMNSSMGKLGEEGNLEVRTAALDELQAAAGLRPPTLLKIDVEGAEHEVLQGAARLLRDTRPTIFLAAHGYRQRDLCETFLAGLGYTTQSLPGSAGDGNYEILAESVC